jgi:hypothetical protein
MSVCNGFIVLNITSCGSPSSPVNRLKFLVTSKDEPYSMESVLGVARDGCKFQTTPCKSEFLPALK